MRVSYSFRFKITFFLMMIHLIAMAGLEDNANATRKIRLQAMTTVMKKIRVMDKVHANVANANAIQTS